MTETTMFGRSARMAWCDRDPVVRDAAGYGTLHPRLFADEPLTASVRTRAGASTGVRWPTNRKRAGMVAMFGIGALASLCLMTTMLVRTVVIPSLTRTAAAKLSVPSPRAAASVPSSQKTSRLPSTSLAERFTSGAGEADRDPALFAAMSATRQQLRMGLLERARTRYVEAMREPSGIPETVPQLAGISPKHANDEPASVSNGTQGVPVLPIPVPRPQQRPALIMAALPVPRPRTIEGDGPRAAPLAPAQTPIAIGRSDAGGESTVAMKAAVPQARRSVAGLLGFAKADDADAATPPAMAALNRAFDTAVYDIEAGTVYLPGGEALEAHSGMGAMRDNPAFVSRRNAGPTPPHIYDLTLREAPFHGVEAIRLTPVDGEKAVFGRDGLLAHSYLHGKLGYSNGCVAFKEYQRFLAAFKKGRIKRMVVVPRLANRAPPPGSKATVFASRN